MRSRYKCAVSRGMILDVPTNIIPPEVWGREGMTFAYRLPAVWAEWPQQFCSVMAPACVLSYDGPTVRIRVELSNPE